MDVPPLSGPPRGPFVTVVALLCLGLAACRGSTPVSLRAGPDAPRELARGADLYARHCALCHGASGDGLGPASRFLEPPPRDFGSGRFALASTRNGVPTDADLARTLARGMPGSAMPSWSWLVEADRLQLARFVRHLANERMAEELVRNSKLRGDPIEPARARQLAEQRLTPGKPIVVPALPDRPDAAMLERGKQLYLENCAACHGLDGKGRELVPLDDQSHDVRLSRDFTAGVLKGGSSVDELTWRIVAGIPAAAMPATSLADRGQTAALVAYVRTLLAPGAGERFVQRRAAFAAKRLAQPAPASADDPRWRQAAEHEVVLAPLSWHEDAVRSVHVAFAHDGETLAVRVRWRDATRDDSAIDNRFSDGIALQFSAEPEPSLFGMGARGHPVTLWHWQPFRPSEVAGLLDLLAAPPPHAREFAERARSDAPVYLPAADRTPADAADTVQVEGFASLPEALRARLPVGARPQWRDGEWQVVLTRALAARSPREIGFAPGAPVQFAVAAWNGAAGDRLARKSISIWQELVLE